LHPEIARVAATNGGALLEVKAPVVVSKLRILLAEDNAVNQKVALQMLKKAWLLGGCRRQWPEAYDLIRTITYEIGVHGLSDAEMMVMKRRGAFANMNPRAAKEMVEDEAAASSR